MFETILNNLPEAISVISDNSISYENEKFKLKFSTSRTFWAVEEGKEISRAEILMMRDTEILKTREEEYYQVSASEYINGGKLFIFKDVTSLIKYSILMREQKMQEMVAATINHELRNPINVISQLL